MTGNRLWTLETVRGFALKARDGTLGSVEDLLFEERSWTVRWLVVDAGTWLHGRRVAIAVTALGPPDEQAECFPADLTRRQVAESPDLPGDRPLGRTGEAALHAHYGWVPYWDGAPLAPALPEPPAGTAPADRGEQEPGLLSGRALEGFTVEGADGPLGEVADLGVACGTWRVRHLIIDTGTWLQGVQLRLPTDAVATLDREERQLTTAMTCADLQEDAFHRIAEEDGEEEDGT